MHIADESGSRARATTKRPILARQSLYSCASTDPTMKAAERERNDWIIILIILLIGFLCVVLAGGWALRSSPTWRLDANMESGINPNGDLLTSRPSGFIPPVDLSILTEPSWLHVFLT